MKIVCDSCGAKYAIADEKVRGKVFKIRCKKCSTVIVVRGLSGESEAAEELSQPETRTFGYDEQDGAEAANGEAVWHLVIDQDQIGPISEEEVRQRFARGEVDLETYAWREGFGDWAALGTIDAFAGLASGQAPGAGMGDMAAGGADPDSATLAGDPFAAAGDQGDGGDLFGSGGNAGDGLFAGAAAGGAADRRMRGERNENSVLFSLNNLAALASDTPKAAPVAASSSAGGGMAQVGGSEGSGLIDIRSMAQTYMGGKGSGGAAQANPLSAFGAVEPVSFATQSPMLLPQAPASGGGNKTLYALIAGLGALLIIGVVVVVMVVLKDDGPTVAEQTPQPGALAATPNPAGEDEPPKADTPPPKPDTPTETAVAAAPNTDTAAPDTPAKPSDATSNDRRNTAAAARPRREETPPKRGSDNSAPTPTPARDKPAAPSGSGGCLDEVGCLLADKPPACCSKYSGGGGGGTKRPSGGGGGSSNLPEKLTRGDITAGVNKVRPSVTGCSSKGKGEVKVTVKVAGSGSVDSVTVKSAPNAALGTCVSSAVKKAKFAKTQQGATFTYPFVF